MSVDELGLTEAAWEEALQEADEIYNQLEQEANKEEPEENYESEEATAMFKASCAIARMRRRLEQAALHERELTIPGPKPDLISELPVERVYPFPPPRETASEANPGPSHTTRDADNPQPTTKQPYESFNTKKGRNMDVSRWLKNYKPQ